MSSRPRFDAVIHAPNRLQVCAMLAAVDEADFVVLRDALEVSDSVLSKHLKVLEDAGYLVLKKATVASRVRTSAALTPLGRSAYRDHVAELRRLIAVDASDVLRSTPASPGGASSDGTRHPGGPSPAARVRPRRPA